MDRNYLFMDWMASFRCVGAECPMTCCAGWNIAIKKEEIAQYKELAKTHPFGEKIVEALDEEKSCMRQCNRRCMMLTEEGWCRIVLECGEENLSATCTYFPRMMKQFGDVLECLVEIACPLVAQKLFENEKIRFSLEEIDDGTAVETEPEVDLELYDALSLARANMMDLFQDYDATYSGAKCYILFSAIRAVQEMYEKNQLGRDGMRQWLERWDDRNFAAVHEAVAPITKRMDLRAVKILELLNKLLSSGAFDILLNDVKDNALEEDFRHWAQDRKSFEEELQEFTAYFAEHYSLVFENYFVYALFREWIPNKLQMDKFGKTFFFRVVTWCLIQLCAMSVWKRRGEVTVEEYSMIVCGLERMTAHADILLNDLVKILADEDNIAMTLLYLIC